MSGVMTAVAIGAAVGAGVGGISAAVQGGDIGMGMLMGGVTGAVTGGVGGAMGGAASGLAAAGAEGLGMAGNAAVIGAIQYGAAGMAGGLTNSLMTGGDPLQGALMGGALGAVGGAASAGLFGGQSQPVGNDFTNAAEVANHITPAQMASDPGFLPQSLGNGQSGFLDVNTGLNYNSIGEMVDKAGNTIWTDGAGNLFNNAGAPVTAAGDVIGSSGASGSSGLFGSLKDAGSGIGNVASKAWGALTGGGSTAGAAGGGTAAGGTAGAGAASAGTGGSSGGAGLSAGSMLTMGAGSLISAMLGSQAAQQAASIQSDAANKAAGASAYQYQQTRADLMPYQATGLQSQNVLMNMMGLKEGQDPTKSQILGNFNPTMEQLAATPGYQWTLNQGLQAAQNAATAQGLGRSGAALKGATNYAEGLAGTTYQQQFANDLAQKAQHYTQLAGQGAAGQNAAATTGNLGFQATQAGNNALMSGAQSQASGVVGSANAWGNAANQMSNMLMMNNMLSSMYG